MPDDFEISDTGEPFPPGSPFRPGNVIAGRYRLDKMLTSGGMGVILVAHHLQLDQRVAIKVLRQSALENHEVVARFSREARAAARIQNEHVARVIDVGHLEGGAPFMVMEYLKGTDLSRLLRERGPLPIEQAVDYLLQACEALAEAHALGIVHRDLKPANLFVTRRSDGTPFVKVLDFGISKFTTKLDSSDSTEGLTKTSMMMGSPQYMSPEQLRSARSVDARADIWALGVTLYKLVSGRNAFMAETTPELCVAILLNPPKSLVELVPGIPPAFDRAVMKCLEKEPELRYQSVAELGVALAPFASPAGKASVERIARIVETMRDPSIPPPGNHPSAQPPPGYAEHTQVMPGTNPSKHSISTVAGSATSTESVRREILPKPRAAPIAGAFMLGVAAIAFGFFLLPRWIHPKKTDSSTTITAPATGTVVTPATTPVPPPEAVLAPTPTPTPTATATPTATPTATSTSTSTAGHAASKRHAPQPSATASSPPPAPSPTTSSTTEIPGFGARK
jgi:serine/threonine-protein kinase